MIIDVLTLFPEMFDGVLNSSILKKIIEKELIKIRVHNFRDFSLNKHKKVDDTVYGGGAGMLIAVQPVIDCLKSIDNFNNAHKIITSPSGNIFNQNKAKEYSEKNHLIIICGHYEGIDERVLNYVDEEVSIGEFILTGGELAALSIIDSVARLIPGAISEQSTVEESFNDGLLEYPQYTKPAIYDGYSVPEVLISGNHKNINDYRRYSSLKKTYLRKPELLKNCNLSKADLDMLAKIKKEEK
ncbi:MAG: tRNA (guanosine(37)-N1)-methyltransferase TrmD [Bacilli bacterium]